MKTKTRKERVRAKLRGRSARPRLSVFVSNKHIYAQIINDGKGRTLVAAKDTDLGETGAKDVETASRVGALLAQRAKEKKVKEVVFDRGRYTYHGRVRALAEAARKGGLSF
ncbi:MAG: 50S ribosomal protein L18 [Candidatus Blackburnbacteria bacterium]|nr:50S ribosomal protein L18 [Candidatus Blackburnbacteria bacterium]